MDQENGLCLGTQKRMDEKQRVRVPHLVRYFVQKFSRRLNKDVAYIPADAMDALANYSWPGNIRELENFIERAVLLSPGKELHVPVSELKPASLTPASDTDSSSTSLASFLPLLPRFPPSKTLSDSIFSALRQTEWRIAGPKGAAVLLGMKRTTLQARIRKLGIRLPV